MTRELKFRAYDIGRKQMEQIDDLYWFEENGVRDGDGSGFLGDYAIMQYTGLKDVNGQKIYEGDLLGFPLSKGVLEVAWNDGGFALKWAMTHTRFTPLNQVEIKNDRVEVVGNIYENPELVEGDKAT